MTKSELRWIAAFTEAARQCGIDNYECCIEAATTHPTYRSLARRRLSMWVVRFPCGEFKVYPPTRAARRKWCVAAPAHTSPVHHLVTQVVEDFDSPVDALQWMMLMVVQLT